MPRSTLDEAHLHPSIRATVENLHADLVHNVQAAVRSNPVLVVGMAGNGYCRRARRALDRAGIAYRYLSQGSYLSGWRRRNALKMWSGWPTLPMVFARGQLIGGATDLERLLASGELQRLLGE